MFIRIHRLERPDWKRRRVVITGCGGIHVDVRYRRIGPFEIIIFGWRFTFPFQRDINACKKWINYMEYPDDYRDYPGFTPEVYPFRFVNV